MRAIVVEPMKMPRVEEVGNTLQELQQAVHYDYILVNDSVAEAAQRLEHIIEAGRCRITEMKDFIREVDQHA